MRQTTFASLLIFIFLSLGHTQAQTPSAPPFKPGIPTPTAAPDPGQPACVTVAFAGCKATEVFCLTNGGNAVACLTARGLCEQAALVSCAKAGAAITVLCIIGIAIGIALLLLLVAATIFVSVRVAQEVIKRVKPKSIWGWILTILLIIVLVIIIVVIAVLIFYYILVPVITFIVTVTCG